MDEHIEADKHVMLKREPRLRFGRSSFVIVAVIVMLALLGIALTRCGSPAQRGRDVSARSVETTAGEFPSATPPAPQSPPPAMLRDPESAVYSYLLWISYAYRILDSDVASPTFSEWEEVRVNSYVEMNRQNAKAIDQRLVGFAPGKTASKGSTATVPVREKWAYRYISAKTGKYSSPTYSVTYDTTYTVVHVKERGWVVDRVEATPVGTPPE